LSMSVHTPATRMISLVVALTPILVATALGQVIGGSAPGSIRAAISYSTTPPEEMRAHEKQRCVFDLYLPAGRPAFATLVWFHEGDFRSGTRTIPELLRTESFAVAAPDYRLVPTVTCEEAIQDAARAVACVFRTIESLGGDPGRIFLGGSGTGAYLAELIALDPSLLAGCGLADVSVAGLVAINGTACTHPAVVQERGGEAVGRIIADRFAPMHHVRRDAPPILLATADRRIETSELYESNAYMWRMLQVAGHRTSRICELQGYGRKDLDMFLPLVTRFVQTQCALLDDKGANK
jgi:hypothetical protein